MANIYKEQQKALIYLKQVLERLPKTGLHRKVLVMNCLTMFAVSEGILQKCIDTYIDNGSIEERDGSLFLTKIGKATQ